MLDWLRWNINPVQLVSGLCYFFGKVGSISCTLNQKRHFENFHVPHFTFMWCVKTMHLRAQHKEWKLGQLKKNKNIPAPLLPSCGRKSLLHLRKKTLHLIFIWSLFNFLADAHAVRLLLQQPFIFDVWRGVRVLRQTSNTLLMWVWLNSHGTYAKKDEHFE